MTYDAFWHRYLRAHARRGTRALHYLGSVLALGVLLTALLTGWWWGLIVAPVLGYGFAWAAHAGIEGNRPETFGHPLWSLASDFRMLALWFSGRLAPHIARAAAER